MASESILENIDELNHELTAVRATLGVCMVTAQHPGEVPDSALYEALFHALDVFNSAEQRIATLCKVAMRRAS